MFSLQKCFDNSLHDCIEWQGELNKDGYGILTVKGKKWLAHRYAMFKKLRSKFKFYMIVCHKCDNKRCVNPKHLYLGTHIDNYRDRALKDIPVHLRPEHVEVTTKIGNFQIWKELVKGN